MRLTVHRSVLRSVTAGALASAATVLFPSAPASAAGCTTSTGVTVVVDFTLLGGGIATDCAASNGGDAASTIFEVHHTLTRTVEYYQVVCKVDDTPADAPCQRMPPADAYWGLFWSDGDGGWTYSSQSVDTLRVPDGGSVAFAWQDGGDQDPPGVAPPQQEEEPSSTPSPSDDGGNGTSGSGSGGGGETTGGGSTAAPSATPSGSPTSSVSPGQAESTDGKPGKAKPSDGKAQDKGGKGGDDEPAQPSDAAPATSDAVPAAEPPSDADDDGLPTWVAPAGIAGLFGIAGAVGLLRRRSMS